MPHPLILYKVIPKTQKAVAAAGGFALVALVVTPVGKRVFLLIVTTIPTVMHDMTQAAATVKKAAVGRSKSPPLAVKKHFIESTSFAIPKGREFQLAVFGEIAVFTSIHHLGSSGLMIVGCINQQYVIYGVISFLYRRSRTFFTANGGLFVFAPFQPATRQAQQGVAENIRELALEIFPDIHRRIGQSPEKVQIFLFLLVIAYSRNMETHTTSNAYG